MKQIYWVAKVWVQKCCKFFYDDWGGKLGKSSLYGRSAPAKIAKVGNLNIPGVPIWSMTSIVLVAQGIWIQSVAQLVPTMLPISWLLPVILKDMAELGVFNWKAIGIEKVSWLINHLFDRKIEIYIVEILFSSLFYQWMSNNCDMPTFFCKTL